MSRSVVVTLAVALLAGCSSDAPAPRTLPPVTTTPPASPDPAPEAPALPPEATVGDSAGAQAFLEHYVAVINIAFGQGLVEPLDALSLPECSTCAGLIAAAQDYTDLGQRVEGDFTTFISALSPGVVDGRVLVDLTVEATGRTVVEEDGTIVRSLPDEPRDTLFADLVYADGAWTIRELQTPS